MTMTPQLLLRIVQARFAVVIVALLTTVITTLLISLMLPKQFVAKTAVLIDVKSPDPVAGLMLPALIAPGYMATQIDIITSERVANQVVKQLRLEDDPTLRSKWLAAGQTGLDFAKRWLEGSEPPKDFALWLSSGLQDKLEVKPSKESNVVGINFMATNPAFAALVANAFAQAYIDVNVQLRAEPAHQYANWFEGQTKVLREQVEVAQQALTAYQRKHNVLAISEQHLDDEKTRLSELSQQLTVLQAQTADSASKRSLANDPSTLPEVMQSPVIMNLKSDINRLGAKLEDSNAILGKNHPQTRRAESELITLKSKLADEIRQITNSIQTNFSVSRDKEREITRAIESQKSRLLSLNQQRDEIAVLKRDIESAQRALETVSSRSMQVRLESQSQQTNVAILTPASIPVSPTKPKVALNLIISIFSGLILGLGLAYLIEINQRLVRSPEDLSVLSELPLLGKIPAAKPPSSTRRLLSNLRSAANITGSLVLGPRR